MAKKVVKKKKVKRLVRGRLFLAFIFFGTIITGLSYQFFGNIKEINEMRKRKEFLKKELIKLSDEEKALESDIQKLEDPTYVARYAREKYLYSKDGELVIRIQE